jgi:hypothetical protein
MTMTMTYTVEVMAAVGCWTRHSVHTSCRAAVDQADLVHGRLLDQHGRVLTDDELRRMLDAEDDS